MNTPQPTPQTSDTVGDLSFLTDLLEESYQEQKEQVEAKKARKVLASGGLTGVERQEIEQKVLEWETKAEWTPTADVMTFDIQVCQTCGSQHSHYVGRFQKQQHKQMKLSRYVKWATVKEAKLPKVKDETKTGVPVCSECCGDVGFV